MRRRAANVPPTPPAFDRLVASRPRRPRPRTIILGTTAAVAIHGAAIYSAMAVGPKTRNIMDAIPIDTVHVAIDWPEIQTPPAPDIASTAGSNHLFDTPSELMPISRASAPTERATLSAAWLPMPSRPPCPTAACEGRSHPKATQAHVAPDAPAEMLSSPELAYPRSLWLAGIEGVVIVRFIVDTVGVADPSSIEILESAHVEFNRAATDLVRGSRFRPGSVGGTYVPTPARMRIEFRLSRARAIGTR